MIQIGVVSDSHGHVTNTLDALRVLQQFDLAAVIHCGDIGTVEIVDLFADWPTHFVLGNVDRNEEAFRRAVESAKQTYHGRCGFAEMVGKQIAFLHGDDQRQLDRLIESGDWDLVCCGHTHQRRCEQVGSTLVLNPGAIYRASPHSIAVVELPACRVEHLAIH